MQVDVYVYGHTQTIYTQNDVHYSIIITLLIKLKN